MQKVVEAFHGLEGDIAGKAVGDNDVDSSAVEVAAFDIADVIERQLSENFVRDAGRLGPLGVFLTVAQDADARIPNAAHDTGVDLAHDGELDQVLRFTLHICPGINETGALTQSRQHGNNGRPLDALETAEAGDGQG